MKILYGVCGEGMGHAIRSAVVAEHLVSIGHDVRFVSNGGAQKYLEKCWPGRVTYAMGLGTVMRGNVVQPALTLLSNVAKQTVAPAMHAASFLSLQGTPDVVISDFDSWTAKYATLRGIPLVAIDNVHFMNRFTHPGDVVVPDRQAAALMYPIVNSMVPKARQYLVTSFVGAVTARDRTTLHLPILRPRILAATPSNRKHVVVYFNDNSDHGSIARVLQGIPDQQFRMYGNKYVTADTTVGNVTWRPFSEDNFIRDLAGASAVIGGAGFTLMTESIFLGKPMLATPFGGQFEQILNANYLERTGYGARSRSLSVDEVNSFLGNLTSYRNNLRSFRHDGNTELLSAVEDAIR
jgi:uncharacterized protein (TIGR00661 family)